MSHNLVIAAIIAVALLALFLLLRGGKQSAPTEQNGVISGAATAMEDVTGPLIGIDIHPDTAGPPDDLTILKGLGPKAAAQLRLLGISRYAQLAALDTAQAELLDSQMGVFRGRLERDRWIDQARHLARGDRASFERDFGNIG